jgi:hypothetical protein
MRKNMQHLNRMDKPFPIIISAGFGLCGTASGHFLLWPGPLLAQLFTVLTLYLPHENINSGNPPLRHRLPQQFNSSIEQCRGICRRRDGHRALLTEDAGKAELLDLLR